MKPEAITRPGIVFLGEDNFSTAALLALHESGFNLVLAISPFFANNVHKRLENVCRQNGIPYERVADINDEQSLSRIRAAAPDLIVSVHFSRLLKKHVIAIPRLGCINLHPSLLPKYRGMAPQHWPIINGESETGISIHYIEEGVDTGDLIVQERFPILPNEYVSEMQMRMIPEYRRLIREAVDLVLSGRFIGIPQVGAGSYYGRLRREQCLIDVDKPRQSILNLVRGVSRPYQGARLGKYIIWRAEVVDGAFGDTCATQDKPRGLLRRADGSWILRARDGLLRITALEEKEECPR
ncbi:MAG: methionyl-tRNA formyltransferase [Kiritimatiellia bacterium]